MRIKLKAIALSPVIIVAGLVTITGALVLAGVAWIIDSRPYEHSIDFKGYEGGHGQL